MNQENILNLDSNKAKRFTLKNHFYLNQQFCLKKSILFVLLVFQFHCLTVYTKNETILEEKFIETKNSKEEKNNYNITPTLKEEGINLELDAFRIEEDNTVNFYQQKFKENN